MVERTCAGGALGVAGARWRDWVRSANGILFDRIHPGDRDLDLVPLSGPNHGGMVIPPF